MDIFTKNIQKISHNLGEGGDGGDRKPRTRRFRGQRRPFGGPRGGGGGGGGPRRGPRRSENGDGLNGKY